MTHAPDLVTAMKTEQAGIRRALRHRNWPTVPPVRSLGVGPQAGDQWATSLEGRAVPSALVSLGFAGGLQDACASGHVILSHTLLAERQTQAFHSDPYLLDIATQACQQADIPHHLGTSLTVLKPALKSSEKQSLGTQTGALSCAMEDYWLARQARDAGVPFLSARVVIDPVAQELPSSVGNLAHRQGLAFALQLLALSWRLPLLVTLAFQNAQAQNHLGTLAANLCSRLLPAAGLQSTLSTGSAR